MVEKDIYVKLQIEKDPDTNKLHIKTQFDMNAPNFSHSQQEISWLPTPAEVEFINEAFSMIQTNKKK